MSKTQEEIFAQTEALVQTETVLEEASLRLGQYFDKSVSGIVFLGCGSGALLGGAAAAFFEMHSPYKAVSLTGGAVMMEPCKYRDLFQDSLVVVVSRSGQTSEVIYALDAMKKQTTFRTLGFLADRGTPLESRMDFTVHLPFAYDESVCQTRTISVFYYCLIRLKELLMGSSVHQDACRMFFRQQGAFLKQLEKSAEAITGLHWNTVMILADSFIGETAKIGALAFAEMAAVPASCSGVLDYWHGFSVLSGPETLFLIDAHRNVQEYAKKTSRRLQAYGSRQVVLGNGDAWEEVSEFISVPSDEPDCITGLRLLNACQMIAFKKAVKEGRDPDRPGGLTPYIAF